ncbi:PLP-dependent transferase [Rickenella mellea]|uniref:PLP-dependent transferase n=1 Tax=Rickenella mellea TaxID=50990 RepID=A0A4Y7QDR7_9AGAM|nr:PLP-dependent transferase [Rickenella mellea]
MVSLTEKLEEALKSRSRRQIHRRIPPPSHSNPSGLIDFNSNDYLSLSTCAPLRDRFLQRLHSSPAILGSGGSRLLVNGSAHQALELRLAAFFKSPTALLFNSGFDANVGFFSAVPQAGDVVIYDEYIHASVHDGIRASRTRHNGAHFAFTHNSVASLRHVLRNALHDKPALRSGENCAIVAVESLYSMDGTFAPLKDIIDLVEGLFPRGNGYVVVDEAHATGLYGVQGRGLVALWGLENRVLARLHTFGKALSGSGAVILTSPIVREYLVNYARPLIYTTSLNNASIIAADCSFDLLEDGTADELAKSLKDLTNHALDILKRSLHAFPSDLVSLPNYLHERNDHEIASPIIPLMSPHSRALSEHLRDKGFNARPISWPTVPKGKDRIRICLHAGNTKDEVESLVREIVVWANGVRTKKERDLRKQAIGIQMEAKL